MKGKILSTAVAVFRDERVKSLEEKKNNDYFLYKQFKSQEDKQARPTGHTRTIHMTCTHTHMHTHIHRAHQSTETAEIIGGGGGGLLSSRFENKLNR